jgi:hypothetical protein
MKFPHFMEPEDSLSHSQKPATCSCLEPDLSASQICFPILMSCQIISPSQKSCEMFRNIVRFSTWGVIRTSAIPQAEVPPPVGCRGCLFNIFAATFHIRSLFSLLQPEVAPYCGDRDPLITCWQGPIFMWLHGPTYHVMSGPIFHVVTWTHLPTFHVVTWTHLSRADRDPLIMWLHGPTYRVVTRTHLSWVLLLRILTIHTTAHVTYILTRLRCRCSKCTLSLHMYNSLSGFKHLCYFLRMSVDRRNLWEKKLYHFTHVMCMCKFLVL